MARGAGRGEPSNPGIWEIGKRDSVRGAAWDDWFRPCDIGAIRRPEGVPMDLTAQVKEVSGVPIIGLSGEMDVHTSAQLRDAVLALLDKGAQKIVVNLDNVEYVDSTGLGTMVGVLKRMTEQNSKLCLVSSNPLINKVFDITGLTRIFTIKPTDAEAIASFESMTAPAL